MVLLLLLQIGSKDLTVPLTQLPAQKVKGNIVQQSFQKLAQKVLGPDQHE